MLLHDLLHLPWEGSSWYLVIQGLGLSYFSESVQPTGTHPTW